MTPKEQLKLVELFLSKAVPGLREGIHAVIAAKGGTADVQTQLVIAVCLMTLAGSTCTTGATILHNELPDGGGKIALDIFNDLAQQQANFMMKMGARNFIDGVAAMLAFLDSGEAKDATDRVNVKYNGFIQ